ncbi:cell division protein FtsQ/DivIB [Hyphomicrobium sp. CS1GBMeth3]|uniref:cell division protein FtsQ/DivIB n=1 Tax=Hyphomicrobium sp. CS1GBMeth3 TaxID=1892845 RepID=UPI0009FB01B1|nr:cell division protein FtsQ/DivIB [Hyphomicrobium sp. CS1GBMeth3]
MDRRGRELFEVGQNRTTRRGAQSAARHAPSHDLKPAPRKAAAFLGLRPSRARLLIGALAIGLALGAAEETLRKTGYVPDKERIARTLGFSIDQVTLVGHRFSYDRDVFDALDLGNVRTFGALDTAAVKARIERLPWIDTAEITRVYPGGLDIRVTERKPYALWSRTGSFYLIDKTGRVLGAVNRDALPDLPRFAGEGAASEAASLLDTIARYPEVASRLTEAERVSERRWRLKLDNATTLELPADDEVGALEELTRDAGLANLVSSGRTTLDFRGPGRVAIRPEPDANAPSGTPTETGS